MDNLWVLISSILVLFMILGLSIFYSGLVNKKNAINTMKMSLISLGFIPIIWLFIGYSLAFNGTNPYVGTISFDFLLGNLALNLPGTNISIQTFMLFQIMFAAISPAILSGAIIGRMKFIPYLVIICLWTIIVYSTVAHWVWSSNGWLHKLGVLDFAGGAVVHLTAGVSALVASIILRPRLGYSESSSTSHNIPFVVIGACILWFGWFGFNAGSAYAVDNIMQVAFVNTFFATSSAMLAWCIVSLIKKQKITAVGISMSIVIGLVAITPAAGYVTIFSALMIGFIASLVCNILLGKKKTLLKNIDDSLDVFICHGVSGVIGALLLGFFASKSINPSIGIEGFFYGGGGKLLGIQFIGCLVVMLFAAFMTFLIFKLVYFCTEIRIRNEDEKKGLDKVEHGEKAYDL